MGGCETVTSELRIHYGRNENSEGAALSVCPARAICVQLSTGSQQHSPKDGFSLFCWFEGSWTTHVMSMQTPAPREGQRVIMRLQGTLVSLPLVAQSQQTSLYGISLCSWAECFLINLFLALRESLHSNSPSGTDPRPHIQISVDLKTQTKLENLKA